MNFLDFGGLNHYNRGSPLHSYFIILLNLFFLWRNYVYITNKCQVRIYLNAKSITSERCNWLFTAESRTIHPSLVYTWYSPLDSFGKARTLQLHFLHIVWYSLETVNATTAKLFI